jgi:hypothetical protein
VDGNEYYGGPEAAFSLQDVEEWVAKIGEGMLLFGQLLAGVLTILRTAWCTILECFRFQGRSR